MISILLPDLRGGGVERICLSLARELVHAGHDVEFVLMRAQGEILSEAEADFLIHDLNCSRVRSLPMALASYLRTFRPDALLAAMWPLTVIAPLVQRLSGHRCRVVVSEHNTLSLQYANWGRAHLGVMRASMGLGYRLAHHRVGVSSGVVQDIASLSGLSQSAFEVIHNPIAPHPEPTLEAISAAEKLWPAAPGGRVVTVGRMKNQKNHPLLLRAFAALRTSGAALLIVGDGPCEADLGQLAAELGVADRVVLAGFHPDPTPFYRTADLFVLSSDYEGFGNVIVEALAQGTPVVATDCPSGPAEILEGGRWGALVPVGNVVEMAAAIDRALASSHDEEALKRRAADFAPEIATLRYLERLVPATQI